MEADVRDVVTARSDRCLRRNLRVAFVVIGRGHSGPWNMVSLSEILCDAIPTFIPSDLVHISTLFKQTKDALPFTLSQPRFVKGTHALTP